jgi:hypothetical protein
MVSEINPLRGAHNIREIFVTRKKYESKWEVR